MLCHLSERNNNLDKKNIPMKSDRFNPFFAALIEVFRLNLIAPSTTNKMCYINHMGFANPFFLFQIELQKTFLHL